MRFADRIGVSTFTSPRRRAGSAETSAHGFWKRWDVETRRRRGRRTHKAGALPCKERRRDPSRRCESHRVASACVLNEGALSRRDHKTTTPPPPRMTPSPRGPRPARSHATSSGVVVNTRACQGAVIHRRRAAFTRARLRGAGWATSFRGAIATEHFARRRRGSCSSSALPRRRQSCGLGRFARLDVRRSLRRTRAGAKAEHAPVA